MIVCPVCEHAQAHGGECEVCGKRLAGAGAPPPPPSPMMEGLEPTLVAPVAAPEVAIPDLEPTRVGAVHVEAAAVPEFEATAAPPVDADAALIPDLERTEAAGLPDDEPSPVPSLVVCRYCRTPAAPGERVCGRCGMRLPVLPVPAAPAPVADVAICSCGTPVRAALCPACGARHAGG